MMSFLQCPIGGWPADPKLKVLGQFAKAVIDSDVEGMSMASSSPT